LRAYPTKSAVTARQSACYDSGVQPVNIFDYEELAREKLSQSAFDYIAGGADDEITLRRNREAFERIHLRQRALFDVSNVDLSTSVLGQRVDLPVLLAPVALQRLAHPEGEVASAQAAAKAGTIFALSTMASATIEEVAAAANGPKWFQLYVHPDRNVAKRLVQRAEAAGYQAICVTVDVPRLGRRERDLRNQLDFPGDVTHRNYIGEIEVPPVSIDPGQSALAAAADVLIDPSLTWDVHDWLRSITTLPIVLKGIMTAEDASLAVDHGADGIVVSNHGGRQLDGSAATIDALPEVAQAVQGRCEVFLDSGVRRGSDVLKALALGANAVMLGRAPRWGLAAFGSAGAERLLTIIQDELIQAAARSGVTTRASINQSIVKTRFS
jgi:4-hydroxymandelate oxidase